MLITSQIVRSMLEFPPQHMYDRITSHVSVLKYIHYSKLNM